MAAATRDNRHGELKRVAKKAAKGSENINDIGKVAGVAW